METELKHQARMNRTDGCPVCFDGYHAPIRVKDDGTGTGFNAWYRCPNGHTWRTAWADTMIPPRGWGN